MSSDKTMTLQQPWSPVSTYAVLTIVRRRRASTQDYLRLPRIDSHDCVRRRTLTCVNVRWRRTLPRILKCSWMQHSPTTTYVSVPAGSAYVVLVAVLRWRRTRLVLGRVLGLSGKTGSPTTKKSYDSVWPRLKSVISHLNLSVTMVTGTKTAGPGSNRPGLPLYVIFVFLVLLFFSNTTLKIFVAITIKWALSVTNTKDIGITGSVYQTR